MSMLGLYLQHVVTSFNSPDQRCNKPLNGDHDHGCRIAHLQPAVFCDVSRHGTIPCMA